MAIDFNNGKLVMGLRGPRVAIRQKKAEMEGAILLPQKRGATDNYDVGEVLAVGDIDWLETGSTVIYQIPQQIRASTTYLYRALVPEGETDMSKHLFFISHADDLIGTLQGGMVSLDAFQVTGRWVLVRMKVSKAFYGDIVLPENYSPPINEFRFDVMQIGGAVPKDLGLSVGQEVVVERNRCNPIKLNDSEYAFIDYQYIYGVIDESAREEVVYVGEPQVRPTDNGHITLEALKKEGL